jgi:hypothetical protein
MRHCEGWRSLFFYRRFSGSKPRLNSNDAELVHAAIVRKGWSNNPTPSPKVVKIVTPTKKAVAAVVIILFLSMVRTFSLSWLQNYARRLPVPSIGLFHLVRCYLRSSSTTLYSFAPPGAAASTSAPFPNWRRVRNLHASFFSKCRHACGRALGRP